MVNPEAAKDEQQRGDHQRLITEDDNKPTGAASTGWRWWRLVYSVGVLGTGWLACGMDGG